MFGSVAATQTTSMGPFSTSSLFTSPNSTANLPSTGWSQPTYNNSFGMTQNIQPNPPTLGTSNFPSVSGGQNYATSYPINSLNQLPDIQQMKEAFNLQSSSCRFRYIFYNASTMAATVAQQVPQGMDSTLWEQIQRNNPDPSRLVPVQLSGFDELQTRIQQQSTRVQEHLQALTGIENILSECSDIERTQCALKLAEFRNRYYTLFRRLVQFIGRVWCLLSRGRALRIEENQMKDALEALQRRVSSPGELHDKLADLIELFRTNISLQKFNELHKQTSLRKESLERIYRVISKQQEGLDLLLQVSYQLESDLNILADGLKSLVSNAMA
ncbi:nucleoporin P54 [Galdieria sulphuraria]|uniref:Nucleoporin P54 n=1 Tax=Galdieria sulphuraria TaxID=130081 RepID=M2X2L9_GALSU|nr:nucleoporin P54 [Galdieria sulphuraria]EME30630.1 nucleoporin P54 [Galdieria sulphuraria]|eukprot:XP_005707150.1 nucleoporin P54 [Galdieria sulphuraria]